MDTTKIINLDNVKHSNDKKALILIDQTQLPNKLEYIKVETPKELFDAIFFLKVRGAPAIGIAAAYGIYVLAQQIKTDAYAEFFADFRNQNAYIDSSRPTAVNLSWALRRMEKVVVENQEKTISEILDLLEKEAVSIQEDDFAMCTAIAEYGLSLLKE